MAWEFSIFQRHIVTMLLGYWIYKKLREGLVFFLLSISTSTIIVALCNLSTSRFIYLMKNNFFSHKKVEE